TGVGQLGQIPTNRRRGDPQQFGQPFDAHLALSPDQLKDLLATFACVHLSPDGLSLIATVSRNPMPQPPSSERGSDDSESRGLAHGFAHALGSDLARAGDVERRAVIDRCADDGQSNGDVDSGIDAENLDGAVPLVVVHRDDEIVVSAAGEEEGSIGWQRPDGVDAGILEPGDCGSDLLRFFAVAEEAVLTSVRVDRADADMRLFQSGSDQGLVSASDSAFDQSWFDLRD